MNAIDLLINFCVVIAHTLPIVAVLASNQRTVPIRYTLNFISLIVSKETR